LPVTLQERIAGCAPQDDLSVFRNAEGGANLLGTLGESLILITFDSDDPIGVQGNRRIVQDVVTTQAVIDNGHVLRKFSETLDGGFQVIEPEPTDLLQAPHEIGVIQADSAA
jgi:hypothetical protein